MVADLDLVKAAQAGSREAFAKLVGRHQRAMMRVALRLTRDLESAEDVVQDSFIKAYQKLETFEGRSSFKSWMFQITMNTAKNKIRGARREQVGVDHLDMTTDSKAEAHLLFQDLQGFIRIAVEELPERQKTALSLRIFEDLSFKEIADIMECPYDTAKANYRHALMKLKEKVEKNEDYKNWHDTEADLAPLHSMPKVEVEA
jgi:RNA polymerase sigma-70 factor (ECF subfamily)